MSDVHSAEQRRDDDAADLRALLGSNQEGTT